MDDMASSMEVLTPDACAKNIISVIHGLKAEDSGKFIDNKGIALPF